MVVLPFGISATSSRTRTHPPHTTHTYTHDKHAHTPEYAHTTHTQNTHIHPDTATPSYMHITPGMVDAALAKLKLHKASGHDGMPAEALKALGQVPGGVEALAHLFSTMVEKAHWPQEWNTLVIRALLKPGKPPLDPASYRPIHLEVALAKLFCTVTDTELRRHLDMEKLAHQFGFRANRGCRDALFVVREAIRKLYSKGG